MSTSTTFPRKPAGVSGGELSHSPPPSNEGRFPSIGSGAEEVIIGFMACLHSVGDWVAPSIGLASIRQSRSRVAVMTPAPYEIAPVARGGAVEARRRSKPAR